MSEEMAVIEQQARELPAVRAHEAMVARAEVTVEEVVAQREKIGQVMQAVMKDGVHFGRIPGISKPTLLKPGAEVLCVTFRFSPSYHSDREYGDGGHLTVTSRCVLTHITSGSVIAEGEGLCTTYESKYAYRQGGRRCPTCGESTIRKGKAQYGGGWFCSRKDGGCGANFEANDPLITSQDTGRVANPDLPDSWNTVLKMANKRALVAAVLNGTAASDIFTQDVEEHGSQAADTYEVEREEERPRASGPRWNKPQSWTEIAARLEARLGEEESKRWVEQAVHAVYGVTAVREVEDKNAAAERMCEVIRVLDEADVDPLSVGIVGLRVTIQAAFATGFDGVVLDGPPWRLGPDELDRPTKDEYDALGAVDAAAAATTVAYEAGVDDIPFGPAEPVDDIPFGTAE